MSDIANKFLEVSVVESPKCRYCATPMMGISDVRWACDNKRCWYLEQAGIGYHFDGSEIGVYPIRKVEE